MPKEDVHPSDYAFLEGRLLRLESEQKSLRRIYAQMTSQIDSLTQALQRLREENETHWQPFRETTDVRNLRRTELDSLRAERDSLRVRAKEAEEAEIALARAKGEMVKRLAFLAPAIGAIFYALAEVIRSFAHHP